MPLWGVAAAAATEQVSGQGRDESNKAKEKRGAEAAGMEPAAPRAPPAGRIAQAEPLVIDLNELLFDAMVAANERLEELERQLAEESRAEAKTRHVEEHALRFEVGVLL